MRKCFLVSKENSDNRIQLSDNVITVIGRGRESGITEKACSRRQVQIRASFDSENAHVVCLGPNSSMVEQKELKMGQEDHIFSGQTLYLLQEKLPYTLEFQGSAQKRKSHDEAPVEVKKMRMDDDDDDDDEKKRVAEIEENLQKFRSAFKGCTPPVQTPPQKEDGRKFIDAGWMKDGSCLVYNTSAVRPSDKIAGFDLDSTLISTASGRVFPKDHHDWKIHLSEVPGKLKELHNQGFKVVIFSNQRWLSTGKLKERDHKDKVEKICAKLGLSIQAFFATADDMMRKPRTGMWHLAESAKWNCGVVVDRSQCLYVGDAAGRAANWEPKKKKDHSCSDRLFCLNLGVRFLTPEEYFLGRSAAAWIRPQFDPREVLSPPPPLLLPQTARLKGTVPELILMVGFPACGKSHFCMKHILPLGYKHISRDSLGTWQKCVSACTSALSSGLSAVIDNTNLDRVSRERYLACARNAGVEARCFWVQITFQQSRHNEKFRELIGMKHEKINEMVFNQMKSKFQEPSLNEGFSEIIKVNFVPEFRSSAEKELYCQFLLER